MRNTRTMTLLGAAFVAIGCGAEQMTATRQLAPAGRAADSYPDSAGYFAAGNPSTGGPINSGVGGVFQNSNSNWHVSAFGTWRVVTDAGLSVTGKVINNSDGTTLNSNSNGYTKSGANLVLTQIDTNVYVDVSTLNHTCGITGKSSAHQSAALHITAPVSGGGIQTLTLWSDSRDPSGTDVTLPNCPIADDQWQPSPCPGQLIYDPDTCDGEGGGGGGNGFDPNDGCTYYLVTPVISYDDGLTWEQNGDSYIVQVC